MERMPHLVENCNDICMSHQSRLIWCGFRDVRNKSGYWIATLARTTWDLVTGKQGPHCCVGEFRR